MNLTLQGVVVPRLIYGTAWKEEHTAGLVETALVAGFRGIDTANQRKHYCEAEVGAGLSRASAQLGLARSALFLQSKFTYLEGQDARLPFDRDADLETQVRQSCASSLVHLGVEFLDSLLLHGPRAGWGLSDSDREVWRTMEALERAGQVRWVGVSNVSAGQLADLCAFATIRPAFVQNRCYAQLGWDHEVRAVCRSEGVLYQGFSLLTANRAELASVELGRIAAHHGRSRAQIVFRFALQSDMIILTGTSDPQHMLEDLAIDDFELSAREVAAIERISW